MKLQLALDTMTIPQCLDILSLVAPDIDIIEIGTPLIIREGLSAVRQIRRAYPDKQILADLKIADAGAHEAQLGFDSGADLVTVLAAADKQTIQDAVKVAHQSGKQILVDLIGQDVTAERIARLENMKPDLICVHNAVDQQALGRQATADLAAARPWVRSASLAVAGGVNPDNIVSIASLQPDVVIVGSGITSARDPAAAARQIRQAMTLCEQTVRPADTRLPIADLVAQVLFEINFNLQKTPWADYEFFLQQLIASPRLFIAGAGRSGLVARAFAMRLMHLGKPVFVVGDVVTPAIGPDDTLLILSGSGETSGLVQIAKKARTIGSTLLVATIQPRSTLGLLADLVLHVNGASPKAVQQETDAVTTILPMGSLFEQSLAILLETTVIRLMEQMKTSEESMFARHANLE